MFPFITLLFTTALATCPSSIPSIRNFFYLGGGYDTNPDGTHVWRNQMYIEHLQPINTNKHPIPIILIHGQGQTGTASDPSPSFQLLSLTNSVNNQNFLNTPDNRPGWSSYFLSQGHEVYIVDQTLRARSPWFPEPDSKLYPTFYSAERIQERFTATQNYNQWPLAHLHSQWPGNGTMGDSIFDAFYSAGVSFLVNATLQESTVQEAGAKLLDKIGKPAVIFGHSQGGPLPLLIADARPNLAAGLVLLEPSGPPFQEAIFSTTPARPFGVSTAPLTFSPAVNQASDFKTVTHLAPNENRTECILQAESPAPRQLSNFGTKPILVVTSESSYHAMYDYCSVKFLRQAGCKKLEHLELDQAGIHGNGHMFFMEKNNLAIAERVEDWIKKL